MGYTSERMIAAAPSYYESSAIFAAIQEAQADGYDSVEAKNEDLRNQLYIKTATWGLDYWESTLKIRTIPADSYSIRRSRVLSAWRSRGQFSAELIRIICEAYTNGAVEVTVDIPAQNIIITFTGTGGIPENLGDLQAIVENIIHAHLGTEYVFTWSMWNYVDAALVTFNTLDTMTWDSFEKTYI